MIIDADLQFSSAQAITADAASTNIIDLTHSADSGVGTKLQIFGIVTEVFDNLTSLDISLQVDDNSSFSSATTLWKKNFLLAALTAGRDLQLPPMVRGMERYARLHYDVNGTNPSTGKITSGISFDVQANKSTADGVSAGV